MTVVRRHIIVRVTARVEQIAREEPRRPRLGGRRVGQPLHGAHFTLLRAELHLAGGGPVQAAPAVEAATAVNLLVDGHVLKGESQCYKTFYKDVLFCKKKL